MFGKKEWRKISCYSLLGIEGKGQEEQIEQGVSGTLGIDKPYQVGWREIKGCILRGEF